MGGNRYSFRGNIVSIEYTYEIVSVNEEARCMEVVYTSKGHQTQRVGTRLPYEGETLEAIIEMYAPVQYWIEQSLNVVVPSIGTTGTIASSQQSDSAVEPVTQMTAM